MTDYYRNERILRLRKERQQRRYNQAESYRRRKQRAIKMANLKIEPQHEQRATTTKSNDMSAPDYNKIKMEYGKLKPLKAGIPDFTTTRIGIRHFQQGQQTPIRLPTKLSGQGLKSTKTPTVGTRALPDRDE